MSEWAYKKCDKCGYRTHINSFCSKCGGDPWNINGMAMQNIEALEFQKQQLINKIKIIDNSIDYHRAKIKH